MTQDNNLTDKNIPDLTDGDDPDMNKFEQEIQRDQPMRASRRHISRMNALLNEELITDEPIAAGQ